MVKYMSLEEQVDKEFLRAKHRAFFRRLVARVTAHCSKDEPMTT